MKYKMCAGGSKNCCPVRAKPAIIFNFVTYSLRSCAGCVTVCLLLYVVVVREREFLKVKKV